MNVYEKRLGLKNAEGFGNDNVGALVNGEQEPSQDSLIAAWRVMVRKYYETVLAGKSGMNRPEIFTAYRIRLKKEISELAQKYPDILNWSLAGGIAEPFSSLLSERDLTIDGLFALPVPQPQQAASTMEQVPSASADIGLRRSPRLRAPLPPSPQSSSSQATGQNHSPLASPRQIIAKR